MKSFAFWVDKLNKTGDLWGDLQQLDPDTKAILCREWVKNLKGNIIINIVSTLCLPDSSALSDVTHLHNPN